MRPQLYFTRVGVKATPYCYIGSRAFFIALDDIHFDERR